ALVARAGFRRAGSSPPPRLRRRVVPAAGLLGAPPLLDQHRDGLGPEREGGAELAFDTHLGALARCAPFLAHHREVTGAVRDLVGAVPQHANRATHRAGHAHGLVVEARGIVEQRLDRRHRALAADQDQRDQRGQDTRAPERSLHGASVGLGLGPEYAIPEPPDAKLRGLPRAPGRGIRGSPSVDRVLPLTGDVTRPRVATFYPAGMDDAALVARVLAGDAAAFTVLVDRYYGDCSRFALRMLANAHDAEDALQETFLSAYAALGR